MKRTQLVVGIVQMSFFSIPYVNNKCIDVDFHLDFPVTDSIRITYQFLLFCDTLLSFFFTLASLFRLFAQIAVSYQLANVSSAKLPWSILFTVLITAIRGRCHLFVTFIWLSTAVKKLHVNQVRLL